MDLYTKLKVKPIINAWGTVTKIGGSTMDPEVLEAMTEASRYYVSLSELHNNAGNEIANMIGVDGAFITSGAAAAITLATAVCIAGSDVEKIYRLPDSDNMKNEIIMFKSHRFRYDQGVRICGGKIIEVGLSDLTLTEQIEKAINEKTAMFLYLAESENLRGSLSLNIVSNIVKKRNIPLVVDAAAELPPVDNFIHYISKGADLAIFSGGKDIRGPQSSGLILGRKDLIDLCKINSSPNHGVCRGMKVDKETIIGLTKAIEIYLKKDWKAEFLRYKNLNRYLIESLSNVPWLTLERGYPNEPGIQPASIERVYITVDSTIAGFSTSDLKLKLEEAKYKIVFGEFHNNIVFNPQMLTRDDVKIIISEIKSIVN
jgi:uncharacterized pyridoxal phosphate-dependent enzyme